jgi:hypothetical protein
MQDKTRLIQYYIGKALASAGFPAGVDWLSSEACDSPQEGSESWDRPISEPAGEREAFDGPQVHWEGQESRQIEQDEPMGID